MEEYLELQRLVYRVSEGVREEGRKDLPGLAGKRATSENPLKPKFAQPRSDAAGTQKTTILGKLGGNKSQRLATFSRRVCCDIRWRDPN